MTGGEHLIGKRKMGKGIRWEEKGVKRRARVT